MLTKQDKTLINSVWESKKYGVKRLIKEFPNKKWSKRGVDDFQKRLWTTRSIERAPGSGRPRTTRTAENVDAVGDLVQSQENQPRHTAPLDRSRECSEYLKQIIGDDFLWSPYVIGQTIIFFARWFLSSIYLSIYLFLFLA